MAGERASWLYDDIQVESAALNTTGGRVWGAAKRLCQYLEATADAIGMSKPGVRILELGSGTGWLGLMLARNLPQADLVAVSEQPSGRGLAWLRHNVYANQRRLPSRLDHVRVVACDWRDPCQSLLREDAPVAAVLCRRCHEDAQGSGPGVFDPNVVFLDVGDVQPDTANGVGSTGGASTGCCCCPTSRPRAASTSADPAGEDQWDFVIGSDLV
eukprot:jgi/Mesvir1/25747/Mv01928-RA.1